MHQAMVGECDREEGRSNRAFAEPHGRLDQGASLAACPAFRQPAIGTRPVIQCCTELISQNVFIDQFRKSTALPNRQLVVYYC